MIDGALRAALERELGARIERVGELSGGDINRAFGLTLSDGRRVFMKTHDSADRAMFPAEARGLAWLGAAGCLRVPEVHAVSSGAADSPAFLVLELLESAPRRTGFDEELGRGLAELHRAGTSSFGLGHDNFIAILPQRNRPRATWAEFYLEERLRPQLERATRAGHTGRAQAAGFERLAARLPELVGPDEPPARLHGDLWGGNLHVDERGAPCLIDPAVYGGHREVDLAMMRLFGGFGSRVFDAYGEVYPLSPGHRERIALYQLYPLLVHVNLFGGSYVGQLDRALRQYT